ncbi:maleylpyruvate isomerase N-terminal domain-containing protein [Pseudonocardia asaccharolytica]|uniref:Mycothiol-dependent maleylpyruvate isomerase metal-binding domain-containing protein n=1 Tax=Pseudonocardia asaccharolytica DSM 44247 = NBRC 16224 TaxID=1123024 RepID=A0A511D567_9PSEU|nr:maleylpyruvate isomerase N-terminal domain-containing protein [Pseudonocardia asaccharolytica]GEL19613.1 hypothetical protein PA7_34500 [Pseudonocardia asaccharolytica DSM 44247 = NBRC 16224]
MCRSTSSPSTRELAGEVHRDLVGLVTSLAEPEGWAATACAGWCVRDLVAHLLGGVRHALVALGTPADGPPDIDAIRYWTPGLLADPSPGADRRGVRVLASLYPRIEQLATEYADAVAALLHLGAGVAGEAVVRTRGRALRVDDLFHILAVEATVHHDDLVAHLDRPGPSGPGLTAVRAVLDGLLGSAVPVPWDDVSYLRAGTGRVPLTARERTLLGADAYRFPLLG